MSLYVNRLDDLIFIGLNGYALALHRETGDEVWRNSNMKSGFATLLLDGDRLIVSTNGYIYCLDPLNGQIVWENPLSGLGTGVTDMTSVRGSSLHSVMQQAKKKMEIETTTTSHT
jgi:outer membrane protein assembly factor BamB